MTLVLSKKMAGFTTNLSPIENNFQKQAFEQLLELDFPTTRDEYWKYTRVGKIANVAFTRKPASTTVFDLSEYIVSETYIVIENGVFRSDLSQFDNSAFDISIKNAEEATQVDVFDTGLDNTAVFTAINNSFFEQVIHIEIAANKQIEKPLQILSLGHGENVLANHRLMIHSKKSSNATIINTFISNDNLAQFDNAITTVNVEENAHLVINKIQASNAANLNVSTAQVTQGKNSTFKINTFTLNGLLQRNNINIAVDGENCETYMNGAIISKGKQHVDNHTFVDHKVPNCYSNENYKYVLDGSSTGVFNGRVVVRPDAQVINAYQNNGNILLSEDASINSKPELEIYADDVKCSHGSTTGQLDEDALFYLQARGLSKGNARKLLVSAFVGEVIESVDNAEITTLVQQLLKKEHGWDF